MFDVSDDISELSCAQHQQHKQLWDCACEIVVYSQLVPKVNSYPSQLVPKSTRTHGQLVPKSSRTHGQLVPKYKRNAK